MVAAVGVVGEVGSEEVELFVEGGLGVGVVLDAVGLREVVAVAVFYNLAVEEFMEELVGGAAHLLGLGEVAGHGMFFVGQTVGVGFAGIGQQLLHLLCRHHQALRPDDVVAAEILYQRHSFFGVLGELRVLGVLR